MSLFFTIALVHLLALMSPGPDFFFVTQTAVSRSRSEAMMGVLGISLGIVFWAGLSLLGLQLLFDRFAWLQRSITVAGACYLIWLGCCLVRSAVNRLRSRQKSGSAPCVCEHPLTNSPVKTFCFGLLTNLSNPKALIYFTSVFSLFMTPDMPESIKPALFVLVISETFVWFSFVALVFSLPALRLGYQRLGEWIDAAAGIFFIGFGLSLFLS